MLTFTGFNASINFYGYLNYLMGLVYLYNDRQRKKYSLVALAIVFKPTGSYKIVIILHFIKKVIKLYCIKIPYNFAQFFVSEMTYFKKTDATYVLKQTRDLLPIHIYIYVMLIKVIKQQHSAK
jgi:hypothetical protein